ncbi:glucan endo-1,3-beta-glucosidase 8-like [Oryza glaberrima]|uniref:glucan endo-1,3-beta-glucosidase 8-like n=1 Tax=Oryza glaberrima TaxID=4538 RepID=UPI00224C5313|nr:glucan endo-1,3-beta-glucosidase 8-like [Oryza glaberrima]
MAGRSGDRRLAVVAFAAAVLLSAAEGLGVNWGTMASHPLPPRAVVRMLQDNGISKVKLFDADAGTMEALAGSGVEVMVAIPNNLLDLLTDYDAARDWVHENVSRYSFDGGVNIKYVAVGNEPFLSSLNGTFLNVTFPALQNIQRALYDAGHGDTIKATVPLNADVYNSPENMQVPSAGRFRPDIAGLMTEIVQFLNQSGAPFTVNIYPFLSLYGNDNFPLDYAFFDGTTSPVVDTNGIQYTNVFDANFDTLVSALVAAGVGGLPVVVGEVGWPTDGDKHARADLAQRFYAGLLRKLASNAGTPLRPNQYVEVYLFSLVDEDAKSVAPGNFERHWGILRYDGQPKYAMDLAGQGRDTALVAARGVAYLPRAWCVLNPSATPDAMSRVGDNVNYACTYADCTSLGYGSTCNGMDAAGNASYAFNAYFQVQNQVEESCGFQGLAVQTQQDPSTNACNFTIQIEPSAAAGRRPAAVAVTVATAMLISVLAAMVTTP